MRTNESTEPERFKPLGEKVVPKPAAPQPTWKPVPGAAKGVEVGPDGKLRTNLPLPQWTP